MNAYPIAPHTPDPEPASIHDTLLRGRPLFVARAVWAALVLLILVVFCMGIPGTFKIASLLQPATRTGLAQIGLPVNFPAVYIIVLDALMMGVFALFGAFIFWRRSNDWMVMFVGLTLLLTALLYTAPAFEAKVPVPIIAFLAALAEISQVMFIYLFPNGRFVPRQAWILLVPLFVWRPAMWGLIYLPHFLSLQRSGENFYYIPQDTRDVALFLALLAIGVIAQMYRYRRYSTRLQRQQTKWLVLGIAVAVIVVGGYVVAINTLEAVQQLNSQALLMRLLGRTVNHLALILLPITLTFSILRYRLWDIDVLINRALVYGSLTGTLAAVYVGLVLALQYILHGFIGGNQVAIVGSTLAIAALFQPLRRNIQKGIDRRFYRRKYDIAQTLGEFSTRLREETDLSMLSEDLLAVVEETMQPTYVSLWLWQPEQREEYKARFQEDSTAKTMSNNT